VRPEWLPAGVIAERLGVRPYSASFHLAQFVHADLITQRCRSRQHGCSDLNSTEQRTLTGGAGGATAGAFLGAIGGNAALGAGVGAGVGLLGGYLYDQYKKSEESSYQNGYNAGRASGQ